MKNGKTATIGEALDLLKEHRAASIKRAREIAKDLAETNGAVTAREVRSAMVAEGSYRQFATDRWLGVVFLHPDFEKTGDMVRPDYHDSPNASHKGTRIEYWRLRRQEAA